MKNNTPTIVEIETILQTVFDPEFPIIDIRTMGLIYDIAIDEPNNIINIKMTLTSPTCPAGDQIIDDIQNQIKEQFPATGVNVDLTFEPMRTYDMMKDEDLKRMFE